MKNLKATDPSTVRIGFVILSHGHPGQLHRLVDALDREYQNPPIACHHDFGQVPLDTALFGSNVWFVKPHISTAWAKFSIVHAALVAISLLYEKAQADWFVLLSASDYPIMSGVQVKKVLTESECDAFLDARAIEPNSKPFCTTKGSQNPKLDHFNSAANLQIKRRFYMSREFWFPIVRLKPRIRLGRFTFRPDWEAKHPYSDFPCYFGDLWFCGNTKVAKIILEPTARHLALRRHLHRRTVADETYFQTVLMNERDNVVCLDNKRFAEWNGGGAHPMFLSAKHLNEMLSSGAFFGRKFQHGSKVLDLLDDALKCGNPAR